MKSFLVLNFKNFAESTGAKAVKLAKIAEHFAKKNKKFQVVVCPSFTDLASVAKVCNRSWVFAQHVDVVEHGAFTGSFPVPVAANYCQGTLLNHSEHKIPPRVLKNSIQLCRKYKIKTLVCASNVQEAKVIAKFNPNYVALEIPELIGTLVSVSKVRPQIVENAVEAVKKVNIKLPVLVGAGIADAADVAKSLELGANGVLVATAFAKNKNPKNWLERL